MTRRAPRIGPAREARGFERRRLLAGGLSVIAWFFAAAISASEPSPAGESSPPPAAFVAKSRILFQGDSITDGNRGRGPDPNHILGHGYAFLIAARFGGHFPELELDFMNRGVSGNTAPDLEKRWRQDTLELKPDLLSVLIGVNDLGHGLPLDQFEPTYDRLLGEAKAANPAIRLVLCEPFGLPTGKRKETWISWSEGLRRGARSWRDWRRSTARRSCPFSKRLTKRRSAPRPNIGFGTASIRLIGAIRSWPTRGFARCTPTGPAPPSDLSKCVSVVSPVPGRRPFPVNEKP